MCVIRDHRYARGSRWCRACCNARRLLGLAAAKPSCIPGRYLRHYTIPLLDKRRPDASHKFPADPAAVSSSVFMMAPRPASSSERTVDVQNALSRFRNEMPTPCSNCRKSTPPKRCLVDVRSGRCKSCNDLHVKCDLRVTFKEFEKLAATRARLSKEADSAEEELDDAEREAARLISEAHELVAKARAKARRKRKELRRAETNEDDSYQRELAAIEELRRMEESSTAASSLVPSVDDLLASSELLEFPDLGPFSPGTVEVSAAAWEQLMGTSSFCPLPSLANTGEPESSC